MNPPRTLDVNVTTSPAALDHDALVFDLQHAPSIRLLRSDSAPLVLSFLYREFKHAQRVSVAYTELVERLDVYLEVLNERHAGLYPRPATAYLNQWCDDNHRFLHTSVRGSSDEQMVVLSADTERALDWISELHRQTFIGTESRFLSIFSLLTEIVQMSTVDVGDRLAQLEQRRAEVQAEIDTIRATGRVETFTPTQVRERFLQASDVGRHLLRDFAAVEENFRDIARRVQEAQYAPDARKGTVVSYVLDADDELKSSDQGRSFYAFWEFLLSPARQDELHTLLDTVYQLPALQDVARSSPLLRHLTPVLIDAGEKIVSSNSRLADQLRRMLDERTLAEARRARELMTEIKQRAIRLTAAPPDDEAFILLEGLPEVALTMEKGLWEPTQPPHFSAPPPSAASIDLSSVPLESLYSQFVVDEAQVRRRIQMLLETRAQVTLAEVVERYPLEQGLAEMLAYLTLATRDARHAIDASRTETIPLTVAWGDDEQVTLCTVPQVTFRSRRYE